MYRSYYHSFCARALTPQHHSCCGGGGGGGGEASCVIAVLLAPVAAVRMTAPSSPFSGRLVDDSNVEQLTVEEVVDKSNR